MTEGQQQRLVNHRLAVWRCICQTQLAEAEADPRHELRVLCPVATSSVSRDEGDESVPKSVVAVLLPVMTVPIVYESSRSCACGRCRWWALPSRHGRSGFASR